MRRPSTWLISLLALALTWGCASSALSSFPSQLIHEPGERPVVARLLRKIRDQFTRGESAAALRAVESVLADHPKHVNATRLRQDILRRRGRLGLVLWEADERLVKHPQDSPAHYLSGRLVDGVEGKRQAFERAIELDAANFWGWFGLAFALRGTDNDTANSIYGALFAQTKAVRVGIAYADSLRIGKHEREAFRVFQELRNSHPGISALGRSESLLRTGKHKEAWPLVRQALELRAFDGGVRALVANLMAQGLPQDGIQELLDVLRADPARMADFAQGGAGLLATMFQRAGDPHGALQVLVQAAHPTPREKRLRRQLRLQCEGVTAYLRELADAAVPAFLADEGNQVRDRWQALLRGPWMAAADPFAEPGRAADLIRAVMRVGQLSEADTLASQARLRHADDENELEVLQNEIRQEIAFEAGLRRVFTRGYARFALEQECGTLDEFLDALRNLSKRTLGKDVVGTPERFELPFVGTLIDSLGPGLPAHLARYNKHLVMGQRLGRPTEGMILTRLSMRYVDAVPTVPMPPQSIEIVGEHRELEPLEQADLAGIALLNHYVVDMDEVRNWAGSLAERRRIAAADENILLRDPIPADLAPILPAGAEWRLALLSPVADADLDAAVLDIIRWHERGHMVDFQHLLPVELHPIRSLALTLRNGLSPLAVASEMEGRAELVALAMSPHTRLVAAHLAGFLVGEGGTSPHAHGFRDLVHAVLVELKGRGIEDSAVRHWHKLDPKLLRDVGKTLLSRLW